MTTKAAPVDDFKAAALKYFLEVAQNAMKLMHENDDFKSLELVRQTACLYLKNPTAPAQDKNDA